MNEIARYIKLVEWSEEDQCFVGQCPGVIGPCCHGSDEIEVYRQLLRNRRRVDRDDEVRWKRAATTHSRKERRQRDRLRFRALLHTFSSRAGPTPPYQ